MADNQKCGQSIESLKECKIFTEEEFDIIGHTLGIEISYALESKHKEDKNLPDKFYRNYYHYGRIKEHNEEPKWIANISKYLNKWTQSELLYFQINELGIEKFKEQFKQEITDKFVPMSKSKERYQKFLRADTGQSFAEYLGIVL